MKKEKVPNLHEVKLTIDSIKKHNEMLLELFGEEDKEIQEKIETNKIWITDIIAAFRKEYLESED